MFVKISEPVKKNSPEPVKNGPAPQHWQRKRTEIEKSGGEFFGVSERYHDTIFSYDVNGFRYEPGTTKTFLWIIRLASARVLIKKNSPHD